MIMSWLTLQLWVIVLFKNQQLNEVEKMIRLHYELDINLEGIDAIYNLLNSRSSLQFEIRTLQNKLNAYEDINHFKGRMEH